MGSFRYVQSGQELVHVVEPESAEEQEPNALGHWLTPIATLGFTLQRKYLEAKYRDEQTSHQMWDTDEIRADRYEKGNWEQIVLLSLSRAELGIVTLL